MAVFCFLYTATRSAPSQHYLRLTVIRANEIYAGCAPNPADVPKKLLCVASGSLKSHDHREADVSGEHRLRAVGLGQHGRRSLKWPVRAVIYCQLFASSQTHGPSWRSIKLDGPSPWTGHQHFSRLLFLRSSLLFTTNYFQTSFNPLVRCSLSNLFLLPLRSPRRSSQQAIGTSLLAEMRALCSLPPRFILKSGTLSLSTSA